MTLENAMRWADLGWPVFPCSADKKPRTKHGFKDASCDPDEVRRQFADDAEAMVGIATGAAGLVVVDVDVKADADGYESLHELELELGLDLTDTMVVDTPSGGQHLYFRAGRREVESSAGRLAPGLDVRAIGGYVIAAASSNGRGQYLIVDGHGPERLAELPVPLAERLASTGDRLKVVPEPATPVPEGRRHVTLVRMAATMRRAGFGPDAVEAALLKVPCVPPHDPLDIARIAYDSDAWAVRDASPAAPELHWLTGAELAEITPEEPDYVLAPYLARGLTVQLAAKVKAGKTTLASHIVRAVLHGHGFLEEP